MKLGRAASKKNILEALLREGMVLVALDARTAEVEVPAHLAGDLQLRLNLSHRFGLPLQVDPWGVVATLTFAGNAFECRVPWAAIFLLVSHASGQPYLFPEDIPNELLAENQVDAGETSLPRAPRLALVPEDPPPAAPAAGAEGADESPPGPPAAGEAPATPSPPPPPPPPSTPARATGRHLKLVK